MKLTADSLGIKPEGLSIIFVKNPSLSAVGGKRFTVG